MTNKKPTAVEQYLKAVDAAEVIRKAAVDELKRKVQEGINELNAFGDQYQLVRKAAPARSPKRAGVATTPEKHCSICNLAGHDARNHRMQNPKKKFSQRELAEKGLPVG